jgi:tetratricopeptide (TPR) repeat protein
MGDSSRSNVSHNPGPISEKVLSLAERHRLQQLFEQAQHGVQQPVCDRNLVHKLLSECVVSDPGNLVYVEAMLENLLRQADEGKGGSLIPPLLAKRGFRQAVDEQHWEDVLRLGPDLLKHVPHDLPVLRGLAQACAARGYHAVELRYLQCALRSNPDDVTLNRELAKAYARVGRFDEALDRWHRVEALDPYDAEAARMIATLTLEKSRHGGGEDAEQQETVESAEVAAPERTVGEALKPPRKLVLTRRQELEQALANNPEDENNYVALAEHYLSENRTFEAQRTLIKALDVTKDLRILERLEDVNMLRAKEQIEIAQQRAREEKTTEAYQLIEKLRDESNRLELEIYRARCERYPNDHRLRFELGLRLKSVGQFREALEPLQGGLEVAECRASASLEIGEILQRYQQFPRALQCYRQSAQLAAGIPDQADCRKRALYRAGVLAEAMSLTDSARQYLAELVKMEPNYRDARDRLDKLAEIVEDV